MSPPVDALAFVDPNGVTLDGCGAATRVRRRGAHLDARWDRCGSFAKIRVAVRIATPACDAFAGTIRARHLKKTRFSAARSTCGDGRVDTVAGEACDTADTCGGGTHCFACGCVAPTGACATTVVPPVAASHVPVGSPITWADDPPTSGASYPAWAKYTAYAEVIPRGYWVHDLENGGVALIHRYDLDFASSAALRTVYQAIPVDGACGHRRALLTPDPLFSGAIAAVAWGVVMRCDAVDPGAILEFVAAHRGQGPTAECADGAYP